MLFFEALDIEKSYGTHKALDKVSIHVPKGSVYGLLGPNGAGKTTLIRIINRITAPDKGEIFFNGKKFCKDDQSHIGYLPEERGLYRKMKVGEQALYLAQLKGLDKKVAIERLRYWFTKFEMIDWWHKKVEELSKGMAQKVQFVITVLHEPKLLIFDEPFSGFDPVNAGLLKKEVLELRDKGTTIIFSTHDMASVEELCDHITLINRSKAILEGPVFDIKQKFKSNLFEIEFDGNKELLKDSLNGNYEIAQLEALPYNRFMATIKMEASAKGNDLLRSIINSVNVHSFRELLPSMSDIFIQSVNDHSKSLQHE